MDPLQKNDSLLNESTASDNSKIIEQSANEKKIHNSIKKKLPKSTKLNLGDSLTKKAKKEKKNKNLSASEKSAGAGEKMIIAENENVIIDRVATDVIKDTLIIEEDKENTPNPGTCKTIPSKERKFKAPKIKGSELILILGHMHFFKVTFIFHLVK